MAKYLSVFGLFLWLMATLVNQVEYNWLKKQTGVTSKYINEMWGQYFEAQNVEDEVDWLKKTINALGETPQATRFVSRLWVQLLTKKGYRVSKLINENRDTYFRRT